MLPIYEYAYKLCDRCFGRINMNMATSQIDSAVYYLVAYMHVWPEGMMLRDDNRRNTNNGHQQRCYKVRELRL